MIKVLAQKLLQSAPLPLCNTHTGKIICATCWIKMDQPASWFYFFIFFEAGVTCVQTKHTLQETHTNTHAHTPPSNQFSSPLSIHILIAAPHDVNKLGNPILYIFQRCQSVRMKCCLQALGKFLPSFLAECGSSFICLSMHKCGVGMKSFAIRQLRCYFQ